MGDFYSSFFFSQTTGIFKLDHHTFSDDAFLKRINLFLKFLNTKTTSNRSGTKRPSTRLVEIGLETAIAVFINTHLYEKN